MECHIYCMWCHEWSSFDVINTEGCHKFGYDVIYSTDDGIHMPPVMSYIVGVMSSIEWVWWPIQWMWWQIEWLSSQIWNLCCHRHNICDIIYIEYDVIIIVGAMTYKQWHDILKTGGDVVYSTYGVLHAVGVISHIHSVWYHQSRWCYYTDTGSVMSDTGVLLSFIHHVRSHIHCVWCHKHSRCLVLDTVAVMS